MYTCSNATDKILSKLGEGTFGRVLECWDRKHKDYVAIKIVRNVPKYRDAAMIEVCCFPTLPVSFSRCCLALSDSLEALHSLCIFTHRALCCPLCSLSHMS